MPFSLKVKHKTWRKERKPRVGRSGVPGRQGGSRRGCRPAHSCTQGGIDCPEQRTGWRGVQVCEEKHQTRECGPSGSQISSASFCWTRGEETMPRRCCTKSAGGYAGRISKRDHQDILLAADEKKKENKKGNTRPGETVQGLWLGASACFEISRPPFPRKLIGPFLFQKAFLPP